jgi:uncharacterized RDD family membrane protein YckC
MHQPVAHAAHMQLASRPARLLGQLLDGVVSFLPVLAAVMYAVLTETENDMLLLVAIGLSAGYYFFADSLGEGQSYAKRWLGMAVVHSETGAPCTAGQSFVRNLLLSLLGPIDWIFIFGIRHQRLGDMLAHTVVIEVPRRG